MLRKQSGTKEVKAPKIEKLELTHRSDQFSWLAVNHGVVTNGPAHDVSRLSEQRSRSPGARDAIEQYRRSLQDRSVSNTEPSNFEYNSRLPRCRPAVRTISVKRKTEPRSSSHSSSVYSQSVASSSSSSLSGESMSTVENTDYPTEQRYSHNDDTPASSLNSRLGAFPGDHEACLPQSAFEPEDRARKALSAERALYTELGIHGSSLEVQRRKYRERNKFKTFVANEPHLVSYNIAGHRYFVHEKPQDAALNDHARYLAAIQHETEMSRKGIDPYSDDAEREGSMTEIEQDYVCAIPKGDFDRLWERCREANPRPRATSSMACAFDIPSGRDEQEWFKVDLRNYQKAEEPEKKRKQKKNKGKKGEIVAEKSAAKKGRKKGRRGVVERYFCF